ncbi:hypothetical protein DFH11DRAFT_85099 [Phellopilus nigrolimitatus]|nr:hypothetical protein DFH11DRAFT_85099 [Phellopilus nigrolimitatus]
MRGLVLIAQLFLVQVVKWTKSAYHDANTRCLLAALTAMNQPTRSREGAGWWLRRASVRHFSNTYVRCIFAPLFIWKRSADSLPVACMFVIWIESADE